MDVPLYHRTLQGRKIRLVKIMPDSEHSILSIQLQEVSLDELEFEALSYVWGYQKEMIRIKCNGKWFKIGANLHAALHESRRRRSKRLLWADQICINQDNTEEKTQQVRLMSTIYAKASRVIIWLGEQQPEDPKGWNLAEALYQKCDGKEFDPDAGVYDFHDFDCDSRGVQDPSFNSTWVALYKIISNSWFSRVWVIQELLMAQKSVMWKGTMELDTDVMLWSAMLIARHRNLYENFDIAMGSPQHSALKARNVAASYYDFKKKGPLPIYDTLSRHSGMGATDSRDRFFALAGVSAGLSEAFINYEKTFEELACLVGKMTLLGIPSYQLTEDGIELLVLEGNPKEHRFPIEWLAFHANPQNHELKLPTWVPDLLSPHSPGLLMTGFYHSLYLQEWRNVPDPEVRLIGRIYRKLDSLNRWQISVPNEIEIKGAIFDQVRVIARDRPRPPSPGPGTTDRRIDFWTVQEEVSKYEAEMVLWLSEIRLLVDPSLDPQGSIMDGQSFDAFWRILLYNRGTRFDYRSPNKQADKGLAVAFGYWYLWKKLQMARRWRDNRLDWVFHNELLRVLAEPFEEAEGRVRCARNFFVSQCGRAGWVPFRTRIGDQICVFQGMRIPLVLRPQSNRWEIIGACYVHELMDGEIWDLSGLSWEFMHFI